MGRVLPALNGSAMSQWDAVTFYERQQISSSYMKYYKACGGDGWRAARDNSYVTSPWLSPWSLSMITIIPEDSTQTGLGVESTHSVPLLAIILTVVIVVGAA